MVASCTGRIAFALTRSGVTPGVVTEHSGRRTRVLLSNGNRETWSKDRMFWMSGVRVPMHSQAAARAALEAFSSRVDSMGRTLELAPLWELVADEKGPFTVEELAGFMFDEPGHEELAALACRLAEDETYFKRSGSGFEPASRQFVSDSFRRMERERKEAKLLDDVAAALASDEDDGSRHRSMGIAWLKALAVNGPATREGLRGTALLQRMTGGDVSYAERQAFDVLVRLGVFDKDEILGIHKYQISTGFPPEVIREAEVLAATVQGETDSSRPVLEPRDGATGALAIDDPWTTEVDDALMVERTGSGLKVHVLIADPGAGIELDSLVGREGKERASTLYLPTGKIPMFPPVLSEHAFSLVPGELRPMLDFACTLDPEGRVVAFDVLPVLSRLQRRLTYDEVDDVLEGRTVDEAGGTLFVLHEYAGLLRRRRVEAGARILDRDEIHVRVVDGEPVLTRLSFASPARRLVHEFMVLACTMAGDFARRNGIPCVYRRQDPPDDKSDARGIEPGTRAYTYRLLRSMRRAEITTVPDFHYGLGVVGYTQVTSPLRRFQDFLVHAQFKGFIASGRPPLDTDSLIRIFGDLENRGDALSRVDREARRYWLLKYLARFEGAVVRGEVIAAHGSKAVVNLDETGLDVHVPGIGKVQPGSLVELKVVEVEPRLDHVVVRPVR